MLKTFWNAKNVATDCRSMQNTETSVRKTLARYIDLLVLRAGLSFKMWNNWVLLFSWNLSQLLRVFHYTFINSISTLLLFYVSKKSGSDLSASEMMQWSQVPISV